MGRFKPKTFSLLIIIKALSLLPVGLLQRLGFALGNVLYFFPNSLKQKITINITKCFSKLSTCEQKKLIKSSLKHTLSLVLEMPAVWQKPIEKVLKQAKQIHGYEDLKNSIESDKPVIILGTHLGMFELAVLYTSSLHNLHILYKPIKEPVFDELVTNARQRVGATMLPTTTTGVRSLYKAFLAKKTVAFAADHDPGDSGGGVFVPFFGIQARTMSLAHQLAKKQPCEIYWCFAKRLGPGKGFDIYYKKAKVDFTHDDIYTALSGMNKDIEDLVKLAPEQYEWGVKRFRKRPEGEVDFYQN